MNTAKTAEITNKSIEELKASIEREIKRLDIFLYADSIISLDLQMVAKKFGIEAKNELIDQFGLEEYGWDKHSEEIKRFSKYDVKK